MVREDIVVDVGGGWQPPLIPVLAETRMDGGGRKRAMRKIKI